MATPHAPTEAVRRPEPEEEREIENLLRQESAHGERLVSLVRALFFSLAVAINSVSNGYPGETPRIVRLLLPWIAGGLMIVCWGWYLFVRRSGYRPLYARLSAVLDALVLADFTLLAVLGAIEQGHGVPTALYAGAAPLAFIAFFALVSAGLRQDPLACVLTGAFSVAITGASLWVLRPYVDTALLEQFANLPAGLLWIVRGVAFIACTAVVAFTARRARELARQVGRASAAQSRVIQLFGKYVAPEVARGVLDANGEARAEQVEVTVLFTDLRNFTALSEKLPPGAVLEVLNAHYQAIVPAVHAHGGTVNKFIGDAIMATFGAPLRQGDHAERAVRAAIQMLGTMEALNARLRERELPELEMGIGVATGPVVVGTLGATQRVEYAVIGDTVNTASRLEGLNKELGTRLLLSPGTRDAVAGVLPTRGLGEVPVKGKARPVPVFTIEGLPVRTVSSPVH
ncbi:adenylate/guanylate cyclase domain-containing protein [Hyalangium minutum]|uniref:Adenylate cyclase n=1 Tax=Hyalangium minutum TaxID=394096 RepID=A0A085W8D5_9BACT|nr:adenylate/guanylate cyclase domain-containing protein [Hyalangium minutum]KFE63948.1 Adenylate cyclase [Hyalangium minutum]